MGVKKKYIEKIYDYVFVTHLPSFYKINLYQQLTKKYKLLIIFVGQSSTQRTQDFTTQMADNDLTFDYYFLNICAFESRNKLKSLLKLFLFIRNIRSKSYVLGGWDLPEYWLIAFLKSKQYNYLALESSIFESGLEGVKKYIKKIFLSRMQGVLYSGLPHRALLEHLGYSNIMIQTGGVGLMARTKPDFNQNHSPTNNAKQPTRFLYVGRLAPEKNIALLVRVFQRFHALKLTIVGDGPLRAELVQCAQGSSNIQILGHIPQAQLSNIYLSHDVFILPSIREPWGLVVEEALYHGLPVIASDKVGAGAAMITAYQTGVIFDPDSADNLVKAIEYTLHHYDTLRDNIRKIDFDARDIAQIQSYNKIINKQAIP